MKIIGNFVMVLSLLVVTQYIHASPLEGKAYVVDQTGQDITGGGYDITGDIDVANQSMSVDPWGPFFGIIVNTNHVEVLLPGTYTRTGAGTVTVLEEQVGAFVEIEWAANIIPMFMVWNVSPGGSIFSIADSDGDGIPGHTMISGPFVGITMYYEFTVFGVSEPYVKLSIDTNGQYHECLNGVAVVEMTADVQLFNGAVLESVTWELNNVPIGEGLVKTEELELGDYVVNAIALTTTGQSDNDSASFTVRDTTRPVIDLAFIDKYGNEVTTARAGKFEISIGVTDTCDANPVITYSTATPTSNVSNGDVLVVNERDGIELPISAVRVDVSAKDESGNFGSASGTLTLE
jgi:hypothetical protein